MSVNGISFRAAETEMDTILAENIDHNFKGKCPHCMGEIKYLLPVEPLYDLAVACALIPMSLSQLKSWLLKKKPEFQPRFRHDWPGKRLRRMLTATEIRKLRSFVIVYKEGSHRGPRRTANEFGE